MSITISGNGVITGATTSYSFDQSVSIGGTLTYEDVTNIDSVGVITARQGLDTPTNLVLRTGGSEKLRITSAGLVGIGEDNPETLLHLKASTAPVLTIQNTTNTSYTGIQFDRAADDTQFAIYSYDSSHSSQANNVQLYNYQSGAITLHTSSTERLRITSAGITSVTGSFAVNGNNYPTAGPLSNRNLIINGAMQVAQRGTSSPSAGYQTVDRFSTQGTGISGTLTRSQESLTTGSPYDEGFRNFFRASKPTASTVAAASYFEIDYVIEAQDLATSGWNYTSPSSYITLSFWVRASVSQTYGFAFQSSDGTAVIYNKTFALTANTWTKVVQKIPGYANLTINNDNGAGAVIKIFAHLGTSYNNGTDDVWATVTGNNYGSNLGNSWWTSSNSTFDITGVQLELGSKATPFEHESYGQTLAKCMRYYQRLGNASYVAVGSGVQGSTTDSRMNINMLYPMRDGPTLNYSNLILTDRTGFDNDVTSYNGLQSSPTGVYANFLTTSAGGAYGQAIILAVKNNTTGYLELKSEL